VDRRGFVSRRWTPFPFVDRDEFWTDLDFETRAATGDFAREPMETVERESVADWITDSEYVFAVRRSIS